MCGRRASCPPSGTTVFVFASTILTAIYHHHKQQQLIRRKFCAHRAALSRSSLRNVSSDFDDEDLSDKASSARRQRISNRKEKSRKEQASRRSIPRYICLDRQGYPSEVHFRVSMRHRRTLGTDLNKLQRRFFSIGSLPSLPGGRY